MGFDVYVWRFEHGEPVPLDLEAAREVLAPHVVGHDPEPNLLQVSTGERETADVHLGDAGITFHRFGGDGVMNLLAVLLRRLDAALVIPGGPVVLQRDEDARHLPSALRDEWPAVVARTGAEITEAIRSS